MALPALNERRELGFFDLPYSERQMIVVVPDEVKSAEIKATEEISKETNDTKVKSNTFWDSFSYFALDAYRTLTLYKITLELVKETIDLIKNLRQKGIDVLTISSSMAKDLKFPPGHPRKKTLYVGHPVDERVYFPFSDFHRMMFESKFSEAVILLMSLGAETLEVEHLEGWDERMSASSGAIIPVKKLAVGVDAAAGKSKQEGKSLLFKANLEPHGTPKLPDNLVWYNYESTWMMVATGRLEHGLQDFSLNVNYMDDYGINAKLKASVEKAGIDVASSFQDHKSTVWKVSGKFSNGDS